MDDRFALVVNSADGISLEMNYITEVVKNYKIIGCVTLWLPIR